MICEDHAKQLELFGIKLKNETSNNSILQFKNILHDTKMSRHLYSRLLDVINSYKSSHINIPEITFGVELEFIGYADQQALRNFNLAMTRMLHNKYLFTGKYYHNNGDRWILGRDGSINFNKSENEFGYELSSAKLSLSSAHDILLLKTVLSCIDRYLNGRVNESCGTHIHLSLPYDGIYRPDISRLLYSYSLMEAIAFDPLVPASRRRNTYCKPTQPSVSEKRQKLSARYCEFNEQSFQCDVLRFESRQLEGTLDLNTILNWTILQSHVIYDLISHLNNRKYIKNLESSDAFQLLFRYDLSLDCINFFLDRIVRFRSRKLSAHCKKYI